VQSEQLLSNSLIFFLTSEVKQRPWVIIVTHYF